MRWRRLEFLFLLALTIGVYFRFAGLGDMLYSHDEAYTSLRAAGYTGSEVIDRISTGEVVSLVEVREFVQSNPERNAGHTLSALARSEPQTSPLFFLLAHFWMRLAAPSPATMRTLPAILSLLVIPFMYLFCLELFQSRQTAIFAAILVALSPFQVLFAQDARSYSLWAAVILLSSALLVRAIRENGPPIWAMYAICLALGFYSHQLFAMVAIAHALYLMAFREHRCERRLAWYFSAATLALFLFLPWIVQIVVFWEQAAGATSWQSGDVPWWQYPQRWALIFSSPFIDLRLGDGNILPYLLRVPILILIGYALLVLVRSTVPRVWLFIVLLIGVTTLPFVASDLLSGRIVSIQGRYFMAANLATIVAVAHLLTQRYFGTPVRTPLRYRAGIAILLLAQFASLLNISMAATWWNKNLSINSPEVVRVLTDADSPLLIVSGWAATDLGDMLALSLMVDEDVSFVVVPQGKRFVLPDNQPEVYWYGASYREFLQSEDGAAYDVIEVVPYRLWRIEKREG